MKHLYRYICLFLLYSVILSGCSRGYRLIPYDELKDIITDLMVTQAIMAEEPGFKNVMDSVDYYQPVLDKYGYTQSDLKYTIAQLASRQSKPLLSLYDQIKNDLSSKSEYISYLYQKRERYTNLAMEYFSDTIYRCDSLFVGSMKNYKAVVKNPVKGTYVFTYMYQGHKDYDLPMRKTDALLTRANKGLRNKNKTAVLNRSFTPRIIRMEMKVDDSISYDSLIFSVKDPDFSKSKFNPKDDTSRFYSFRIFYKPDRRNAEKKFFTHLSGIETVDFYLNQKFYSQNWLSRDTDSMSLGPLVNYIP